jgi:hypothetical protein
VGILLASLQYEERKVMSRIAIVKVRSAHDLEWNPSPRVKTLL